MEKGRGAAWLGSSSGYFCSGWPELHPCADGSGECWAEEGSITEEKCLSGMGQGQLAIG